jgi:hypothetical protein
MLESVSAASDLDLINYLKAIPDVRLQDIAYDTQNREPMTDAKQNGQRA